MQYAVGVSSDQIDVLVTGGPVPRVANPGDAGADLQAAADVVIPARGRAMVPTGISIALPDGYVGLVHPRSGLAAHSGITVLNAPGTIDSGYRGEIRVVLLNTADADFPVHTGDRIAQLLVQRYERVRFIEVQTLPGSLRGERGFGSTGVSGPAHDQRTFQGEGDES